MSRADELSAAIRKVLTDGCAEDSWDRPCAKCSGEAVAALVELSALLEQGETALEARLQRAVEGLTELVDNHPTIVFGSERTWREVAQGILAELAAARVSRPGEDTPPESPA